jgi:SAM-dependent methyltransferase
MKEYPARLHGEISGWLAAVLACGLALAGCQKKGESAGNPAQVQAPEQAASPTADPKASAQQPAPAHDPAHPPIDCPLRKQGIDPAHMRPFEEVEQYIAFLDRKDRAAWQKPDEVISALGLKGDETVVDLGAGSGYFAFLFAKALPLGKVIAADIEPEMIRHIHHKAMTEGISNIEPLLIQADEPAIPDGVDLVFICDVLHHVPDRPAWLARIVNAMPSGARLVMIEFKEGKLPEGPPESVKIPRGELVKLATAAGLVLDSEQADLLPYQVFLVFQKP